MAVLLVLMSAERNECYGCLDADLLVLFARVKFLSLIMNSHSNQDVISLLISSEF